jgi:hypothetical protein
MYSLLIFVFGLTDVAAEFEEMGVIMAVVTLVLGNVTLFMFDFLLTLIRKRKFHG